MDTETETIDCGKPPPHIDPKEHESAMLALGLLVPLGMAWPHHPPTPGLLSYLHDPARRAFTWHREMRIRYGIDEATNGISD